MESTTLAARFICRHPQVSLPVVLSCSHYARHLPMQSSHRALLASQRWRPRCSSAPARDTTTAPRVSPSRTATGRASAPSHRRLGGSSPDSHGFFSAGRPPPPEGDYSHPCRAYRQHPRLYGSDAPGLQRPPRLRDFGEHDRRVHEPERFRCDRSPRASRLRARAAVPGGRRRSSTALPARLFDAAFETGVATT
jgi:hypothetical protein